jgi:hypothetical protein
MRWQNQAHDQIHVACDSQDFCRWQRPMDIAITGAQMIEPVAITFLTIPNMLWRRFYEFRIT